MSVPPDRQIRMTRKPVRGDLLAGSLETDVGDPLKQLLEEDARFEPRQMRAEAKVRTLPETEVRIVRAFRKEALRVGEFPLIAVGRDEINHHLVARPDRRPREFNLRCRGTPHHYDGRDPAGHFLDSGRYRLGRFGEKRKIVRLQAELLQTA